MSDNFDVAVIGSGPGGYVAAIRAAQLKQRVIIIEKDKLGGVCLNIGCIPSKALIHQAHVFNSRMALEGMGVKVDVSSFDYSKVNAASRKAADTLSRGVAYLLKKNGVTVVNGTGVLVSDREILVNNEKRITAKAIILATGSSPRQIKGFEFDEQVVLSSTGALLMQKLPGSMLILGGGAIGVEFAHIVSSFGVKVTIVEMMDRILPGEDAEVSELLRRSFVKRGMDIRVGTKAVSMERRSEGAEVVLENREGVRETISVERVLVVTGRVPNTEGIGLEALGIKTDRGYVLTGDYGETSVKGVYAIGDIVPTPLLAHVASKEGEIAAEHIAGYPGERRLDPLAVPGAIYTEPQVASFGYTESAAKEKGIACETRSFPYKGVGKAVAEGRAEGFVKVVFESSTHEILGVHAIGAEATELIHEYLLAKKSELLPSEIAGMIHAHPTMSEAVMESARAVEGWAIHS
ncbi:MAG: dihydrolipoyl dehydrogenase [Fibrobacter sp.]|jgi:dihydrolipoamide dehydrogenase|nr:dihydrolipoyl dehydrogenase [Fibrobacter sp.]